MSFDISSMMGKVREMQENMQKIREDLSKKEVSGESGGGMVKILMNGEFKTKKIEIAKELINQDEAKMLEDLIVAAFNNAVRNVQDLNSEELSKVKAGLPNIPGLNF